jgi:UDP-glucose 4-epimerase
MTVLVTGGAGYIGSHMVYALVAAGDRVIVLDNLSTGFDWAVAAGVPLVIGETGDQNLLSTIIKEQEVECIIHFAASIVVPDSVADPLRYYKNNTVNSRALIECAVAAGVPRFIFSSTAAVYGNPAHVPVTEDEALMPMSPYGSSKLMTEIMLRDASAAHGLSHVILRYFNVAGADPELRTGQSTRGATHLIKVAVETALGRRAGAIDGALRRRRQGYRRGLPIHRCAGMASARLSPICTSVFVGLDQGWRAGGVHQRRKPAPFRDAEIRKPLIWRGLERC